MVQWLTLADQLKAVGGHEARGAWGVEQADVVQRAQRLRHRLRLRRRAGQEEHECLEQRLYGAMDCGLTVNPALVENQMVGQMIQSTSRILKEEVTFDNKGVTSLDWSTYQVLRMAEHPQIVPVVVQRLEEPSTGAGEEVMGATAAAIANAFFDATGHRMRQFPMTPERVKAVLNGRPT
jgi:7-keto-8-aminopelargonate synthetase-like enzyme